MKDKNIKLILEVILIALSYLYLLTTLLNYLPSLTKPLFIITTIIFSVISIIDLIVKLESTIKKKRYLYLGYLALSIIFLLFTIYFFSVGSTLKVILIILSLIYEITLLSDVVESFLKLKRDRKKIFTILFSILKIITITTLLCYLR